MQSGGVRGSSSSRGRVMPVEQVPDHDLDHCEPVPRRQLPGIGEGIDLGFHGGACGVLVVLGGILWRRLHRVGYELQGSMTKSLSFGSR